MKLLNISVCIPVESTKEISTEINAHIREELNGIHLKISTQYIYLDFDKVLHLTKFGG